MKSIVEIPDSICAPRSVRCAGPRISLWLALGVFMLTNACAFQRPDQVGRPSIDQAAQAAYARGLEAWRNGQQKQAQIEFRQAVTLDPQFGEAWAYRAMAFSRAFRAFGGLAPPEAGDRDKLREEAAAALERARQLSPHAPETKLASAVYLDDVMQEYQKAVDAIEMLEEQTSLSDDVLLRKARLLSRLERPQEALKAIKAAVSKKPNSVRMQAQLISLSVFAKDCVTAADAVRRASALGPTDVVVFGMVAFYKASCLESIEPLKAHLTSAPPINDPWGLEVLASFWTFAGEYDRAVAVVRRALPQMPPTRWMALALEEANALKRLNKREALSERLDEIETKLPALDPKLMRYEQWHYAYHSLRGDTKQTRRWIQQAKRRVIDEWRGDRGRPGYTHLNFAIAFMNAGLYEESFSELAEELENPGGFSLRFIDKILPDSFRMRPKYRALHSRFGD